MASTGRYLPSAEGRWSLLAGVAAVSGSYAVTGPTPVFVASPVERAVARVAPIELIVFAIQTLSDFGQQLNYLGAIVATVLVVAAIARLMIEIGERAGNAVVGPLGTTAAVWWLVVALTGETVLALGAAVPAGGVVLAPHLAAAVSALDRPISGKRRRVLSAVGAAVGIAGLGYVVGSRRSTAARYDEAPDLAGPNVDQGAIEAGLVGADAADLDVRGLGPLISEDFYEVDINAVDPNVPAEEWTLSVTGAVEESFTVDYEDVLAMPAQNRFVTLRCVSDDLNGEKMGNALWTGVPVRHILERATPTSDCGCVKLSAADQYFQVFPLEAFEDGLLAYGMNGSPLPRGHGNPLRTLVPGHWGEINVKWLYEIEFLEEDADGYWERRGWHGTGPVVPVAKIETARLREDGTRQLGGHAYGGTRGVASVEVSTNGGETWAEATLSRPLGETVGGSIDDTDAWRQWAHRYEPPEETHTLLVRMIDENGAVQPSEERDPYPRGASGWVSREF
jgi:DMSO/TMAO reductase YedYZ molybdopterin-dependent catalytic subunit